MAFDGTHKAIPLGGIVRAGADSTCADGVMNELIGLELRDGSFVPYKPETTSEDLTDYPKTDDSEDASQEIGGEIISGDTTSGTPTIPGQVTEELVETEEAIAWEGSNVTAVYYHAVSSGYKNRLILTNKNTLYLYNKGEAPIGIARNVKDVSFVGNIACISTESGIIYYIYNTSKQKYQLCFDTYEDLPTITLQANSYDEKHQMTTGDMSGNLLIVKSEDEDSLTSTVYNIDGSSRSVLTYQLDEYSTILHTLANKAQYSLGQLGRIHGYCLAVTAYRLTTGEYVWASSPILIGKPNIADTDGDVKTEYVPRDLLYKRESGDYKYVDFRPISAYYLNGGTGSTSRSAAAVYLSNSKVVNAVYGNASDTGWFKYDNFDSQEGVLPQYAPPMFGWYNNNDAVTSIGEDVKKGCFAIAAVGNTLSYRISSSIPEKYNGVIDAACVFISEIISPYEFSDITIKSVYDEVMGYFTYRGEGKRTTGYRFISKDADRLQREITNLRNFYKVAEIPFKDIKRTGQDTNTGGDKYIYIDLKGVLGDNLYLQETLPVSAFDRKQIIDASMFVYNSRLHLYNYTEKMDISSFLQEQVYGTGQYTLPTPASKSGVLIGRISLNNPEQTTITFKVDTTNVLNPFLSYPDRRANKLELFDCTLTMIGSIVPPAGDEYDAIIEDFANKLLQGEYIDIDAYNETISSSKVMMIVNYYTYSLSPSQNGGFAMYLGVDGTDNILSKYIELKNGTALSTISAVNSDTITYNRNKLKVSEASTPYVFPYKETYRIGNEQILGLAVQTSAEAQYNYGKYPLLAFCSDGIYSMSVNETGSGAYATSFQSALDVCINTNTICSVGNGIVLFASNKGLMAVTPNGVIEFFSLLNGEPRPLPQNNDTSPDKGMVFYKKLLTNSRASGFTKALAEISEDDFVDYLKDSHTHVSYAYSKGLALIYNEKYAFVYAIDVASKYATKIPLKIHFEDNDVSDKKYYLNQRYQYFSYARFTKYGSKDVQQTVFQTRPIKIEQGLRSHIRVILRGYFKKADVDSTKYYAALMVLGSIDGESWQPIGYSERHIGEGIHDIGCVTERVSCNYIMVIFCAQLEDGCHLDKIELSSESKYNNKLR